MISFLMIDVGTVQVGLRLMTWIWAEISGEGCSGSPTIATRRPGWLALAFRLGLGDRLLDVLQHERELVRIDLLRSRAEAMTLKHLDDGDQTRVLVARGDEQFLERPCSVGKRIRRRRHDLTESAPIVGVTWKI
jgi:hypothetical protein